MKVLPNIVCLNCSLNRVGNTALSVMSSMTRVSSKFLDKKSSLVWKRKILCRRVSRFLQYKRTIIISAKRSEVFLPVRVYMSL